MRKNVMIAITKTELRENLKKYLDLASTECVVVTMGGGKSIRCRIATGGRSLYNHNEK